MSGVPINHTLYKLSKTADETDCTFVFKDSSGEGSTKEIHAHRCVLSSVSPYFKTHLKTMWKGDKTIEIVTVEYSVFQGILKAIYLSGVDPVEDLQYGLDLYEAAHFYQLDDVVDLVRERIKQFCDDDDVLAISPLFNISIKYQDYAFIEFLRVYFTTRADVFVSLEDFNNYPIEAINILYQIKNLNIPEVERLQALETYVEKNGEDCIPALKPAIKTINFKQIFIDVYKNSVLISEEQKNILIAKDHVSSDRLEDARMAIIAKRLYTKHTNKN